MYVDNIVAPISLLRVARFTFIVGLGSGTNLSSEICVLHLNSRFGSGTHLSHESFMLHSCLGLGNGTRLSIENHVLHC